MAVDPRLLTFGQPNLVYKQLADSTAQVETTTETSLDTYPTFAAGCFVAGDVLEYYYAGVVATDSTPTITLALFWGTQAGTLLLRTGNILLTATGEDGWFCRGHIIFRSATSVIATMHTAVKVSATLANIVRDEQISAATTIAQTADTPLSIAVDCDVSTGIAFTITQTVGLVWHHRFGL